MCPPLPPLFQGVYHDMLVQRKRRHGCKDRQPAAAPVPVSTDTTQPSGLPSLALPLSAPLCGISLTVDIRLQLLRAGVKQMAGSAEPRLVVGIRGHPSSGYGRAEPGRD